MRRSAFWFLLPVILIPLMGATCFPADPSAVAGVTPIHQVQGEDHRSPLLGQTVVVEGIVTAVRGGTRVPGFWLQDSWVGDAEAHRPGAWTNRSGSALSASSGIFVLMDAPPEVRVGDAVRVSGVVEEFDRPGSLSLTEIRAGSVGPAVSAPVTVEPVRVGAPGLAIPEGLDDDGLTVYEPQTDAIDFWEALEGSVVEIGRSTVVGASSRYGDFVVIPEGESHDVARTAQGGILLREGEENMERIIVDASLLRDRPRVAVGDGVERLTGVVHYDFGNYRIILTEQPTTSKGQWPASVVPEAPTGALTVASYNALNLSFADSQEKFDAVARSIVSALRSPDVVGLQEIQDDTGGTDDGVVAADQTLKRLVDAIAELGGPRYEWSQINPLNNADGGAPGSNIRVGYLVNPDRVRIIRRGSGGSTDELSVQGTGEDVHLSLSPGRIGTATECFLGEGSSDEAEGTRKSLALEIAAGEERYFLINNHLKSKRGDDPIFGSNQPPRKRTEEQRSCQTRTIAAVVSQILERNPRARVIVLGDMNEHEFRPPLDVFESAGLISMIERVPLEQRYTYNYLGNSQVLDHVFVSPSVASEATLVIPHINTVLPDGEAASDHDPLLLFVK